MATTRTKKPSRTTRTKAEVENAFDEIADAHTSREALDPQAEQLRTEHALKVRGAVSGLSVDKIVQNAASLGLSVQRTLNDLTEQCVAKAEELKTLQEAVELESQELERLYKLDVASAKIQLLIQDHEAQKADLEREISHIKAAWREEQLAYDKNVKVRNDELAQARKREEDAYNYNKLTERNRADDDFQRLSTARSREMQEKLEGFNKHIEERTNALLKDEAAIEAMKARFANIDVEIDAAVKKDVAIQTNAIKRELEHKHTLEVKDLHMQLALANQKNTSLEADKKTLAEQIFKLQTQVDAAREQVKDIAVKSVEGASGQTALSKIMEIQNKENGTTARKS